MCQMEYGAHIHIFIFLPQSFLTTSMEKPEVGGPNGSPAWRGLTLLITAWMVETLAALRDGKILSDQNEILHRTLCHSIEKNYDPARRI